MTQAQTIANLLLTIGAVKLNVKQPFKFTSGIYSPIYCDNRLIISHPKQRKLIVDGFLQLITQHNLKVDVIAGTATAGIPHAAWLADRLNLPMVYVRSKAKSHGKQNQIEGYIEPGKTALVIEDLISTGNSALNAAAALRGAGAKVNDCLAIFNYKFPATQANFTKAAINLHTLTDFDALISLANSENNISEEDYVIAKQWNQDPEHWNGA